MSGASTHQPVLAAGTVCWRRVYDDHGDPQIMVLLIHRTKQRDVSFPKGKLEKNETMPEAAARETLEETGLEVSLGMHLGTIHYDLKGGRQKTVQYWAAKVTDKMAVASQFRPNGEVQALEWVPLEQARELLSYEADRELFDVFLKLAKRDLIDTFTITLLRHAKTEPRGEREVPDHLRRLTREGTLQAQADVAALAAFGPKRIFSSTALRCIETAEPIAEQTGLKLRTKKSLSQDNWDRGDLANLRDRIGKIVARGKNAIICSHRPVLPDLAREIALATGSLPGSYLDDAAKLPPAGFSVFHLSKTRPGAGILAVETYPLK